MKKKSGSKRKPHIGYIVRVTTHKHLKGDHRDFENRIITKRKIKNKVSYTPFRENKRRKFSVIQYATTYNEGDVKRTTKVMYIRNVKDIQAILEKEGKKFKESKQDNFSVVTQLYQGKISNRFKGKIKADKEAKITKVAKLFSKKRSISKVNLRNAVLQLRRDIENLSMDEATDVIKKLKAHQYEKKKISKRVRTRNRIRNITRLRKKKRS